MKKLLFILFLLCSFPALADEANISLPKQFLGWWSPLSATTAGFGVNIKSDGKMIDIHEKTKKIHGTSHYIYLYSPVENEAYVLAYAYYTSKNPEIWHLRKELDNPSYPNNYVLVFMHLPCDISDFKDKMLSHEYLVQFIKDGKCMPPYSGSMGPGTDYYHRTETHK